MKRNLLLKRSCLSTRWQAAAITWLLLAIFYALSGEANAAQAQSRVYVTDTCSHTVAIFDAATNALVTTISAGGFGPVAIALTPDGSRVYVANQGSDNISVINTATNTVIATIAAGDAPVRVAITPDGARAYVTNLNGGTISVINTATNTVIATLTGGVVCPNGIAIGAAPLVPTTKDDCKNGGWRRYGPPAGPFRNQGQCVSYVQSHSGGHH